jgi:hypothetical protein
MSTPVKYNRSQCLSCGCLKPCKYRILQKDIKQLFHTYCGVNVAEGIMCENCCKQLETIHRKTTTFKNRAKSTLTSLSGKRCLSRNTSAVSPSKSNMCAVSPSKSNTSAVSPSKIPVRIQSSCAGYVSNDRTKQPTNRQLQFTSSSITPAAKLRAILPKPSTASALGCRSHDHVSLKQATADLCATTTTVDSLIDHEYVRNISISPGVCLSDDILANEIALQFVSMKTSECTCISGNPFHECHKCLFDEMRKNQNAFNDIHHHSVGYVSVLSSGGTDHTKKRENLLNFDWQLVIREMKDKFPRLLSLLLGIMAINIEDANCIKHAFPRLGFVYAIMMQSRTSDMSLLQRMISLVLLDANSEVHVSN